MTAKLSKEGARGRNLYMQAVARCIEANETPERVAAVVGSMYEYAQSGERSAPMAARVYLSAIADLMAPAPDGAGSAVRMLDDITDADEARELLAQFRRGVELLEAKVKELGG